MNFEFLKNKISQKFSSQEEFAKSLGVTRRTLQNWISKLEVPEDKIFGILNSLDLDEDEENLLLDVPQTQLVFRTKHTRRAQPQVEVICKKIAESFFKLSSNTYKVSESIPVLQKPYSKEVIVGTIRKILSVEESEPVVLSDVLDRLKIHNMGIVFFPFNKFGINRTTDGVIFDLLHELAHIVCGHLPNDTTEEDEKFCDLVATEIIYPRMFLVKNEKLLDFLVNNGEKKYLDVKEVIRYLVKDFDWSAMGLALSLKSYEYISSNAKSFNRLMQIDNQMKAFNPTLEKMYFENFDIDNYEIIKSFFRNDIYKSKEIYSGFIELKNAAIYGRISASRLSEILGMNIGDVDELIKSWVMEDTREVEAHEEGSNHDDSR